MNYFLINILLTLICLEIAFHLFLKIKSFVKSVYFKHISEAEFEEEFADENDSASEYAPRYDVEAFKERIKNIVIDEDGLYTPPPTYSSDLGIEIIPEQSEIDIERYANGRH